MSAVQKTWTDEDTAKAHSIWADYQRDNDTSRQKGLTAGIDPINRDVWFGQSAKDIARQRQAQGIYRPLFFFRVGEDYYARKGGRR